MAALKYMLQGLVVHDATDDCPRIDGVKQHNDSTGRRVTVRYRSPEDEVAAYKPPSIFIEFPDISMAYDRMHSSGPITLPYAPEGFPAWWDESAVPEVYDPQDSPYTVPEFPVAYNIDYQITVYARIKRDHLMPILSRLEQWDKLGRSSTLKIPQDGTFRRLTRLAGPHIAWIPSDDNEKKLFTATYLVRVPTELVGPVTNLYDSGPLVNTIIVNGQYTTNDLSTYYNESELSLGELQESISLLSVGNQTAWNTQQLNQ
jgi:hypothetical protein